MRRKKASRANTGKELVVFFVVLAVFLLVVILGFWQEKSRDRKEKSGALGPTVGSSSSLLKSSIKEYCLGEIYQNKEMGYEVCYPRKWFYREFGEGKETVGFDQRPIPEATEYLGRIVIRVVERPLQEQISYYEGFLVDKGQEEVSVGSVSGRKIEGTIPESAHIFAGGKEAVVLVKDEGRTFELSLIGTADSYISLLPTFLDYFVDGFRLIPREPTLVRSFSGNIVVSSPLPNSIIASPLTILGKGRVFENAVYVRLEDSLGRVLSQTVVYTRTLPAGPSGGGQGFGEFSAPLYFTAPVPPSSGVLKVFSRSEKERSEQDMVEIAVRFR